MDVIGAVLLMVVLLGLAGFFLLKPRKDASSDTPSQLPGLAGEPSTESPGSDAGESKPELEQQQTNPLGPGAIPPPKSVPSWATGVVGLLEHPADKANSGGLLGIGKNIAAWMKFNVKGKELGFRLGELQLLFNTAQRMGMDDPQTLLWSNRALDRCLQAIFWQNLKQGTLDQKAVEDFLFRLMQYRQGLEMGRPRYRNGLMSTRSLAPGQALKLMVPHVGMYTSRIMIQNRSYLEIELPKGRQTPSGFSWKNAQIEVYFWRKDDAGYYFDSKVLNSPDRSVSPRLFLNHSESLIRTQKRASVRIKIMQDAWLSPLRSPEDATEKFDKTSGYLVRLLDISDSGAAVLVRGILEAGFLVQLRTYLSDLPVVLCGEIKAVNINREKHYSVLHIEAIPPSRAMRIRILAYVLGVTREDSTKPPLAGAKQVQADEQVSTAASQEAEPLEETYAGPSEEQVAQAARTVSSLEDMKEEKFFE